MWTSESQSYSLCSLSSSAANQHVHYPVLQPTLSVLGQMRAFCWEILDALWSSVSHSQEPAPHIGLGLCHRGFRLGHQDRQNELIMFIDLSLSLEPGWSLCPVSVSDSAPGLPETGDPDEGWRCPSV